MTEISLKHPNLKIFRQHGFIPQGTSGSTQVIGRCPFCGSNKKFFVNPESKKWDCKECSHNGGYQLFLQQIAEHGVENFRGSRADALCLKRGISKDAFDLFDVGYNPVNETYLIPVWNEKKDELYNIRIYRKDGVLMNSAGCKAALFGWWNLKDPHKVIWLCEGEWDSIVMTELLLENGLEDAIVLGVPGATTFKAEWTGYFSGKIVHVVYDNDYDKTDAQGIFHPGAGKQGMHKVCENLKTISRSIDFVHWPSIYKDRFDVNDLYRKKSGNAERTLKQIVSMMKPEPPAINYPEGQEPRSDKEKKERERAFTGEGATPAEVHGVFQKYLHMPCTDPIDIAFATVIANRLPGDPVWMFLIGPSGCGKSEIIMALDDAPRIYPLSRLTPHTLISGSSGAGGGDPSLVPKLNEQVLAIKDFTVVLEMNEQARDAIFSQLRDAYDGKCANEFGTGARRAYTSKFGILAGCTDAIEMYLEGGTSMGERFLGYKFPPLSGFEEECKVMGKAIDNISKEEKEKIHEEFRAVSAKCLNYDFGPSPVFPESLRRRMMALAYWVALMRGTVKRNKYSKEIERKAFIERPTRIVVQLTKFSLGLAQFRRKTEVTDEEFELVRKIAIGTAPAHLELIIRAMYSENPTGDFTTMDFAEMIRLPPETCKRFAENLYQLGVLRQKKPKGALVGSWNIAKDFLQLIELSGIYKPYSK